MPLSGQPQLAAGYRAARLGLAALLGILFAATLIWFPGRVEATGQFGAPLYGVIFLPPVLSLLLDAHVRRSWRTLIISLLGMALVIAGVAVMNISFISSTSTTANLPWPVKTVLYAAYILSIPLIMTAAAAFTVGGLGGYAARRALTAMGSGILAWVGAGALVLPLAYAWFYVLNPCQKTTLCFSDAIFSLLAMVFVGGLVVAPLGGLLGGALRTRVGRSAQVG
jgi:hypothetical protein